MFLALGKLGQKVRKDVGCHIWERPPRSLRPPSPFLKLMGGDWKRNRRLGLEMERSGPRGKKNVCCRFPRRVRNM